MKDSNTRVGLWNDKNEEIKRHPLWFRRLFWLAVIVLLTYAMSSYLPLETKKNVFREIKCLTVENMNNYFK